MALGFYSNLAFQNQTKEKQTFKIHKKYIFLNKEEKLWPATNDYKYTKKVGNMSSLRAPIGLSFF